MSLDNWTYFNPVRAVFAPGVVSRLADHVPYRRAVLVTSPGFTRRGVTARIRDALGGRLLAVLDDVKPNPDVLDIDAQARSVRELGPDCIIALGGGSSMDTAKALARLLTQPASVILAAHFRNDIKFSTDARALPVVAIPTTAGTGAEVTPFGTVWDFDRNKKYSVTGSDLYPIIALLDSELTLDLPEEVTISSGLDAISHALESAWNHNASPVTLSLSAKSLQLSVPALPRLKRNLADVEARGAMMQASLLAGLAISQTRTALAHSVSYPLTTRFKLPHGIACSFTLPALAKFNAPADDGRLHDLARAIGHNGIAELPEGLRALFERIGVSELFRKYVPEVSVARSLVDEMITPGRADNNLRSASAKDVDELLSVALAQVSSNYSALAG